MPKLSIIVPVYNVQEYLQECLGSILAQSFQDFELILVDDGSTDYSGRICDEYERFSEKKGKVIHVIHQKNKGLSEARNAGIELAKGKYIGFVDSDDWLNPYMYESMQLAAEKYDADVVICRYKWESSYGKFETVGYGKEIVMDRIEATVKILEDKEILSFAWNKIYRRTLFEGVKYPARRIFEDTATTYKLMYKANRVVAIPYIGYNYRRNANGICLSEQNIVSAKTIKREFDNMLSFNERYWFAKEHKDMYEILPICAEKAYRMLRSFLHMVEHKQYILTSEQEKELVCVIENIRMNDLQMFSLYEKLDLFLYRIHPNILKLFLWFVAKIHPLK